MEDLEKQISDLSKSLDSKHNENIVRLTTMEGNTKQLTTYVEELHRTLFGNGQPGVLAAMNARMSENEKWTYKAMGAIAASLILMNMVLAVLQFLKR